MLTPLLLFAEPKPIYAADWLPDAALIPWVQAIIGLLLAVIMALFVHLILRNVVLKVFQPWAKRSKVKWDNILFENKVPHRAALLVPLIVLRMGLELVPALQENLETLLQRLVVGLMILVVIRAVDAFLTGLHQIYLTLPMSGRRPIKSYIQLAKVIVYIFGFIFIIAQLSNQTPWFFVSGLGAMMAIVLLIFRDTLLSLVASIQLTNNDLIRVGDWIEMPQFGADGDVSDIALNTVKVQNWDRTITVVPTNKFLEHSFRNYRNMYEGGGRRMMRSVNINSSTIRFLTKDEIDHFSKFALLKDYMRAKVDELEKVNSKNGVNTSISVNSRNLTNIGTLRAYIMAYLRSHPGIHQNIILMVRQLEPTPEGVPIQIYAFINDTAWVAFEEIQTDIFDHILASIPEFGLKLYQRPSGHSFDSVTKESAN
ncbi:MAG: mechanosensitive ion channel family protein [Balneolales bacterium]